MLNAEKHLRREREAEKLFPRIAIRETQVERWRRQRKRKHKACIQKTLLLEFVKIKRPEIRQTDVCFVAAVKDVMFMLRKLPLDSPTELSCRVWSRKRAKVSRNKRLDSRLSSFFSQKAASFSLERPPTSVAFSSRPSFQRVRRRRRLDERTNERPRLSFSFWGPRKRTKNKSRLEKGRRRKALPL